MIRWKCYKNAAFLGGRQGLLPEFAQIQLLRLVALHLQAPNLRLCIFRTRNQTASDRERDQLHAQRFELRRLAGFTFYGEPPLDFGGGHLLLTIVHLPHSDVINIRNHSNAY